MKESTKNKLEVTVKICTALALLYFFICSLDLLSTGFQLLVGEGAGEFFSSADSFLHNPFVGLMIGVLGTVLLQSSSTFTSIIISMVGPTFLPAEDAVYIIMGSNVGTSVTSTLVAMTQAGDRNMFRRAFAAATVHDMFNWCTVIVMFTIEVSTGFLFWLTDLMAEALVGTESGEEIKTIQYITEPLTDLIVQMNSTVLDLWVIDECDNCTLLQIYCPWGSDTKCKFLLNVGDPLDDWVAGLITTLLALFVLFFALIMMVKILNSLFQGAMSDAITKLLNPKFDNEVVGYLYGYLLILVGGAMTFLVQSSSVFTSTITPLVGMGLFELETVYPLFLGANIGTTTTGILAALASDASRLQEALQVSFVHLFFNIAGILLFYPVPFMRVPIPMAKILGNTTAKYRWFAIAYLIVMFILLPLGTMLISLNDVVFIVIGVPVLVVLFFAITVNVMQRKCKQYLPKLLQDWDFLPHFLHSLKPYDRIIAGWSCCDRFRIEYEEEAGLVDGAEDEDEGKKGSSRRSSSASSSSGKKGGPAAEGGSSSGESGIGRDNLSYERD